jgi:hypothetical protein
MTNVVKPLFHFIIYFDSNITMLKIGFMVLGGDTLIVNELAKLVYIVLLSK